MYVFCAVAVGYSLLVDLSWMVALTTRTLDGKNLMYIYNILDNLIFSTFFIEKL